MLDNIIFCYTGATYPNMLPCMLALFHGILCNVETKNNEALLLGVTIHDTHQCSDCWQSKVSVSLLCFTYLTSSITINVILFVRTRPKDISNSTLYYIYEGCIRFKLQHLRVRSTQGRSHIKQIHPE